MDNSNFTYLYDHWMSKLEKKNLLKCVNETKADEKIVIVCSCDSKSKCKFHELWSAHVGGCFRGSYAFMIGIWSAYLRIPSSKFCLSKWLFINSWPYLTPSRNMCLMWLAIWVGGQLDSKHIYVGHIMITCISLFRSRHTNIISPHTFTSIHEAWMSYTKHDI